MTRYLRLLGIFWQTAVAAEMEYRANFVVAILLSIGGFVGNLFMLFLFYRGGGGLGDWAWHEAMVVMGVFTLAEGVSESFLAPNLSRIVRHVVWGTLDFVLLKPVDTQFWVSTRNCSPWGLPGVVFGCVLIGYGGSMSGMAAGDFVFALAPVALGLAMLYSLWFALGATTIWFTRIYNLTEVLRSFMEAGRYPVSAYPAVYRFVFTFIAPVALMTTTPAELMLGRSAEATALGLPWAGTLAAVTAVAIGLLLASRWFWYFALRHYTSASS